jgi:hypothetical protein
MLVVDLQLQFVVELGGALARWGEQLWETAAMRILTIWERVLTILNSLGQGGVECGAWGIYKPSSQP